MRLDGHEGTMLLDVVEGGPVLGAPGVGVVEGNDQSV